MQRAPTRYKTTGATARVAPTKKELVNYEEDPQKGCLIIYTKIKRGVEINSTPLLLIKLLTANYPQEEPQPGPHDGASPPVSTNPCFSPSSIK